MIENFIVKGYRGLILISQPQRQKAKGMAFPPVFETQRRKVGDEKFFLQPPAKCYSQVV